MPDAEHSSQTIRLPTSQPFDWPAMLAFFRARSVAGLEDVGEHRYRRTIALDGQMARLELGYAAAAGELVARVVPAGRFPMSDVAGRLRRILDLDVDLATVAQHLSRDPALAAMIARRPAVRIPGYWDGFETAVRAVLGQQVSLAAARVLVGRLIARASPALGDAENGRLDRWFPTPGQVLAADLSAMGMPGARVRTLLALSDAALADPALFRRGPSLDDTVARLRAVKGIGPWTAHYIALRACREPDAFPASDIGLLRGMAVDGRRPTADELGRRADAWRPFRAYAAHHIWAADPASSASVSTAPDPGQDQ